MALPTTFHRSHPDTRLTILHKALTTNSTTLSLVPKEGLPLTLPFSLFNMFSSLLPNIVNNLPLCQDVGLSIPDFDIQTVKHLAELLTKGFSQQCTNPRPVKELASALGINMTNLGRMELDSRTGNPEQSFQLDGRGVIKSTNIGPRSKVIGPKSRIRDIKSSGKVAGYGNSGVQIKTEFIEKYSEIPQYSSSNPMQEDSKFHSDRKCFICNHEAKSLGSLKAHMCTKHFTNEMKANFSSFMHGKTCGLCQETLGSKIALVIHIGNKHGRLNELLAIKGYPKILPKVSHGSEMRKENLTNDSTLPRNESDENTSRRKSFKINDPKKFSGKIAEGITLLSKCEVCSREFDTPSKFSLHMTQHFLRELKEKFSHVVDVKERACLLCSKIFPGRANISQQLYQHIGSVHGKVEEVMLEKGMKPLAVEFAMPIAASQVKRERPEYVEDTSVNFNTERLLQEEPEEVTSIHLNDEELFQEEQLLSEKDDPMSQSNPESDYILA